MSAPAIQSVGPPPERHADRVVAEMTRWLQAEAERHFPMIIAVLREPRPGNAKAQARHLARLRRAAGPMLLDAKLEPGTRGKYASTSSFSATTPDRWSSIAPSCAASATTAAVTNGSALC